jgi:ubiquitin-protein ligase
VVSLEIWPYHVSEIFIVVWTLKENIGNHAGGVYHGKVKFPPEYPFKPPGIRFTHPFCASCTSL